ncbi:MAG: flagellar hook protein FlgE, partial [Burkholderiaceae bacterium]
AAAGVGLGVRTALVSQRFTQGNITGTSNPLDLAISGGGFFRMSNNGVVTYGRNGQFQLDRTGFIISPNGSRLTGYMANANGALATGVPQELQISAADLPPRQTQDIDVKATFDSRRLSPTTTPFNSADPTSYTNATSTPVYDSLGNEHILQTFFVKRAPNTWDVYASNDDVTIGEVAGVPANNAGTAAVPPATGTVVTALGAIGSTGLIPAGTFSINGISIDEIPAGATLAQQGANVAAAITAANIPGITATDDGTGVVTIHNSGTGSTEISLNGAAIDAATAASDKTAFLGLTGFDTDQVGTKAVTATRMGTINFTSSGELDTTTTVLPITIPITSATGSMTPFAVSMDFAGTQQFGADFKVKIEQDGYAPGSLAGFNVGSDGIITGRYTNGKTSTLGQVILVNFTNPNGLQPLGDNVWADTSDSGPPMTGVPGAGNLGVLQSNAVEDSNVDLTAELVNMITAQRVYQANAQTIKTQDQVLQTLLNMR